MAFMALLALVVPGLALAHELSDANAAFVQGIDGPALFAFAYLGAKHMVTGIDHVLYLVGVVFFLHRLRDVLVYASMFALGHTLTLISGVLLNTGANAYVVDAVIGLSVAYKAAENLGWLARAGLRFDPRLAVLAFGLAHGLGLATKVIGLQMNPNGLLANLISFNVGVEIGQALVLAFVVVLLGRWRQMPGFTGGAKVANLALLAAGLALCAFHIQGYLSS